MSAGQATYDNIIRRMRLGSWLAKATDTRSEYVMLLAFTRQQGLRERASLLRYTYAACLVRVEHNESFPGKKIVVLFPAGANDPSVFRNVKTGTRGHLPSYSMHISGFFHKGQAAGAWSSPLTFIWFRG
jgi:hypothetical protein